MNSYSLMMLLLTISCMGCHSSKRPLTLVPVNQTSAILPDRPTDELVVPLDLEEVLLNDNSPEIIAALKQFEASGKAPIVKRAGFVQFPFGEVQPILNCQPNYGCDVQLQAGEQVQAVILGNEPLWDYLVWESNQQYEPVQHVTIGPRNSKTRTNAIIGTDRRTYHLELLSTSKSEYVRSAKFYYPREQLHAFQARQRKHEQMKTKEIKRKKQERLLQEMTERQTLPYQNLTFSWEIESAGDTSWKPIRAFDDAAHIYLQFPEHIVFEDLPGIYVATDEGKLSKPNWRIVRPAEGRSREKGSYIMVDGLFDQLHLVGGFGGKQETVIIRRVR